MFQTTDIVIPIYNEEGAVPELLRRLREACPGARLIFVDNASTDHTLARLEEGNVADVVRHDRNLGYGRSILDGMKHGTGEHVIVIDADLEFWPEDIPAMLEKLETSDAVIGSRFFPRADGRPEIQFHRSLGNGTVTKFFNLLFRQNVTDILTGLRAFNRSALPIDDLDNDGFEFVLELSAKMVAAGVDIAEIPARYTPRTTGSSKMKHLPEFVNFSKRLVQLRLSLG